jgi:hypothetical protein
MVLLAPYPHRHDSQVQTLLKTVALEAELLARIGVRPPHFALRDLRWHADNFEATAVAEFPAWGEVGPMQTVELGRHGLIAGLCAAAMSQPDGACRHYLAQHARYVGFRSDSPWRTPVRFRATTIAPDERAARSLVEAYTDDARQEQLMLLEVEYAVVPAPVLPVSLILSQLIPLAGELFGRPFWIPAMTMSANPLCGAGERLRLDAWRTGGSSSSNTSVFACTASVDDRTMTRLGLTLAGA